MLLFRLLGKHLKAFRHVRQSLQDLRRRFFCGHIFHIVVLVRDDCGFLLLGAEVGLGLQQSLPGRSNAFLVSSFLSLEVIRILTESLQRHGEEGSPLRHQIASGMECRVQCLPGFGEIVDRSIDSFRILLRGCLGLFCDEILKLRRQGLRIGPLQQACNLLQLLLRRGQGRR